MISFQTLSLGFGAAVGMVLVCRENQPGKPTTHPRGVCVGGGGGSITSVSVLSSPAAPGNYVIRKGYLLLRVNAEVARIQEK